MKQGFASVEVVPNRLLGPALVVLGSECIPNFHSLRADLIIFRVFDERHSEVEDGFEVILQVSVVDADKLRECLQYVNHLLLGGILNLDKLQKDNFPALGLHHGRLHELHTVAKRFHGSIANLGRRASHSENDTGEDIVGLLPRNATVGSSLLHQLTK